MTQQPDFYIPVKSDPPDDDMVKYLKAASDGEARARGGTHAVFVKVEQISWGEEIRFAHRYATAGRAQGSGM